MPRRSAGSNPDLSRQRTAELLKELRGMVRELRTLKARVADLEHRDAAAQRARRIVRRRSK